MKKLAIYEPDSPLDAIVSAAPNGGCNDCELGSRAGISPCISVEGRDQGWLVISDLPTAADNVTRMPFTSNAGKTVRTILSQKAPNIPMAFVHAVGCATSEAEEEHVDACRKYVKHAIERTHPKAILLLGSLSAYSLLGHGVAPDAATGGYAFIRKLNNPERPLPVWFGPDPVSIARNRLVRAKFSRLIDKMVSWKWKQHHGAQIGAHTYVVVTEEDAQEIYDRILQFSGRRPSAPWGTSQPIVAVDVETWRPAFHSQEVVSLALSWYEGDQIVSAVWDTEGLDPFDGGVATLRRLLQDDTIAKVAHNGKFDQHALSADTALVSMAGYVADTRLLCKMLNPTAPADLANCAVHVGMGGHKQEARDALQEVKKQITKYATSLVPTPSGKARPPYNPPLIPVDTIPAELIQAMHDKDVELDSWVYRWLPQDVRIRYNARDTAATIKLWRELQDQLTPGQQLVFHEVVMPATHALTQMEEWGLPIDRSMLNLLEAHLQMDLVPVQNRLQSYAHILGGEFNPGSRPQLLKLMEELKLAPKGKTKTGGISTDDKSLEPLRGKHPIVGDILEWRHLTKMLSTYVEGVRGSICPDGKIHATALLDGTETGRLSYQRPNLQNWPRASTTEGRMLRDCVVAPPGWVLVEIDQSQVEIRVAAALSGDPDMLEIINSGKDFHSATAELIYGPNFTDEQRTASKITNFSLIYEIPENIGYMLSKSLSAATKKNVTREDAQRIADMIFGRYKRLREWMSERHKAGMAQGGAFTKWRGMDARFRPLPNLGLPYSGDRNDPNKPLVETAIRSTWNMPVQGTAADLTTAALHPIVRWIQDSNAQARLLVTIHDSVVGLVHESALADYISVARQAMTQHAGWLGVKLNADVKTGKRLGQMQKYKVE
jgi:DNA polymerase I-like protein with 3'-5' exonuclease and polymerase domains/uracil-DNA glycosylase